MSADDEIEAIENRLAKEGRSPEFIKEYLKNWRDSHRQAESRQAQSGGRAAGSHHATMQNQHIEKLAEETRKDGDEYIVDQLRREDAERTRGRWQE